MNVLDEKTKNFVKPLEVQFLKLPSLPIGIKEFIVSISPWISLILGVLVLLGFSLSILGAGFLASFAPLGIFGKVAGGVLLVSTIFSLFIGVLYLLAFQSLKKGQLRGWNLLFWISVLSLISSLSFGSLFWWLIGLYLLFQIKSYYK